MALHFYAYKQMISKKKKSNTWHRKNLCFYLVTDTVYHAV